MSSIHRRPHGLLAGLVAVVLAVSSTSITSAQSEVPEPSPGTPFASVGGVAHGGVLAAVEGRDPEGDPSLELGTMVDDLTLGGPRSAFAIGETAAFRLELPRPVSAVTLLARLVTRSGDTETTIGSGDWLVDPSWDTLTGTLPVPPVGDHQLRLFRGAELVASTDLAVRDVPRLEDTTTDPLGLVSDAADQVQAARQRYEDALGGWLWLLYLDTTSGAPIDDYTADVWAVNEDQFEPTDALAVIAATDVDAAIVVAEDLASTILPDERSAIADEARAALAEGRWADAADIVADGLVTADAEGPVATPTPRPTPTATPRPTRSPEPTPFGTPDLVGLARQQAEQRAERLGFVLSVTFRRTDSAPAGIVLSQDPEAGTPILPRETVRVVVAQPPATVTVPDITGLTEADAVAVLLEAGLQAGTRLERFSDDGQRGRVVGSDPRAGIVVARGTAVDYVISRGPAPTPTPSPTPELVSIPDVRGLAERDAVEALRAVGLDVGDRLSRSSDAIPAGAVIRTIPAIGTRVEEGSEVDLVISLGSAPVATPTPAPTKAPIPTPTRRPRPTPTPAPTPTATPTPTPQPEGDLLSRITDAGVIRVNVDPDDPPWSVQQADGTFAGYDIVVARQIARRLGVEVEFTTLPLQQVVVGAWNGRLDIAVQRLTITDARRTVLDFSQPYLYDPAQMAVTDESALASLEELKARTVCVALGSAAEAWLEGRLDLTQPPLEPAAPSEGSTATAPGTDADCLDLVAAGRPPFDGWLSSIVTVDAALADGVRVTAVGDPVLVAPIGVAFDRASDSDTLEAAVDGILSDLRGDGSLARASDRWFGRDLTLVEGAEPSTPPSGGDPAFSIDPELLKDIPTDVDGRAVSLVGLSGADLASLLVSADPDTQRALPGIRAVVEGAGATVADLGFGLASVIDASGATGAITAVRLPGVDGADLGAAIASLVTSRYDQPVEDAVRIAGRDALRISNGPFSAGDRATYLLVSGDVAWLVEAALPLLGDIVRTIP